MSKYKFLSESGVFATICTTVMSYFISKEIYNSYNKKQILNNICTENNDKYDANQTISRYKNVVNLDESCPPSRFVERIENTENKRDNNHVERG